jgi:hypothetical protein
MTSRESPPPDGDPAGAPGTESTRIQRDGAAEDSPGRQPNYLIRRGVAIGGVVAAIALGAVAVGTLIDGGGDEPATGAADADWNTIVLVDARTGQVIVADTDGEEQTRFASGLTNPTDALTIASSMLIASSDAASVVDLADESTEVVEFEPGTNGVVMPAGSALTMLTANTVGDRALMVHGPTGDVLDTDSSAPIAGARYDITTAVASPSGRDVLITDAGNFQTILFSFDRDEPSYFPGRALAVSDELVVTTQNVGNEASVTVFDHDGTSITDARAPSVRAGLAANGTVVLVTVEGEIIELTTSNGTTSTLGTVDVGTVQTGHVDPAGTRLIVTGDTGTAVLDDDGAVLATFVGGTPLDTGIDELATRTSSCLATITVDNELVVSALDDGTIVAEATATPPALSSVDGCTVVATAEDGVSVIGADGVTPRSVDGELVAVTPDGRSVVTTSTAGRLLLTSLDSASIADPATSTGGEPGASVPGTSAAGASDSDGSIDLGPASRLVLFTQR